MFHKIERLDQLLLESFNMNSDKTAIVCNEEVYTYNDVGVKSQEISEALLSSGLGKDEPVLIVTDNQAGNLIAIIGIWRSGGVAVPVDRSSSKDTIDGITLRTKARFIIGTAENLNTALYESVNQKLNVLRAIDSLNLEQDNAIPDAALVVFTSGSTGVPKGVILSHRGYCGKLRVIDSFIPFNGTDNILIALRLTFSFGQWTSVLALYKGATIYLVPKFQSKEILRLIEERHISKFPIVPSMMRLLLQEESKISSVQDTLFLAGGEVLSAVVGQKFLEKFPRSTIADIYGLTETNSADFILLPQDYSQFSGTIGWETTGVTTKIINSDGKEAGINEPGELCIKTDFIMLGYIGQKEVTEASFDGDFLKTGDLAYRSAHGVVVITGRLKDEINRGGNKVAPAEIENLYMNFTGLKLAACIAVKDELLGEKILLAYESSQSLDAVQMRDYGAANLEKYKVPDYYKKIESIPVGKTGKLDRAALRAVYYNITEHHA